MKIQELIKQLAELIEDGEERVLVKVGDEEFEISEADKYSDGNIKLIIK